MRVVLKPAGLLFVLTVIALLSLFVFTDIGNSLFAGKKEPAPTDRGYSTSTHGPNLRPINLSQLGKEDWVQIGQTKEESTPLSKRLVRKDVPVHRIGSLEYIGTPPNLYTDDYRAFRWDDGDTFKTMQMSRTGLLTSGIGSGYRFVVTPEVGKKYTLRIWSGGKMVRTKVIARFSDGSPLNKATISYNDVGRANTIDFRSLNTLAFTATKPNQKLIVSCLLSRTGTDGSVSLQAIALE